MAEITCPTDCEVTLPVFKFDDCAPEVNQSQIAFIYLAAGNAPAFEDVSDPSEWASRLGNGEDPQNDIRKITGIGSKPKPTPSVTNISLKRKITTDRAHAITFRVDESNEENHDATLTIQCGGTYKIWYQTLGGLLFGGDEGIKVTIDAGEVLGEGDDDVINYEYLIEWNKKHSPERIVSPM